MKTLILSLITTAGVALATPASARGHGGHGGHGGHTGGAHISHGGGFSGARTFSRGSGARFRSGTPAVHSRQSGVHRGGARSFASRSTGSGHHGTHGHHHHGHHHHSFIGLGGYGWPYYYGYGAGYYPYGSYYGDGYGYGYNDGSVAADVQAALADLGYYNGPIDGVLGPRSRRAIANFQARNGLRPTGRVDQRLLSALQNG